MSSEHQDAGPSSDSSAPEPNAPEHEVSSPGDLGRCDHCALEKLEKDIADYELRKKPITRLLAQKHFLEYNIQRSLGKSSPDKKCLRSKLLEEQVAGLQKECPEELLAEARRMARELWGQMERVREQLPAYKLGEDVLLEDSEEPEPTSTKR